MGDVEWTDEAREAVWKASADHVAGLGLTSQLPVGDQEIEAILAALTPHVEAMVREARRKGYRTGREQGRIETGRASEGWPCPCVCCIVGGCPDGTHPPAEAEEVRRGE